MLRKQISNFEYLENLIREGESIILEFKPENDVEEKGYENRILRGVVALANTRGGNLVIGVEKRGNKHKIAGTLYTQDYILNWISALINSYVDPPDLSFNAYEIESSEKDIRCVCIFVEPSVIKHALRHYGRKSQRLGYHLFLRIGDSSREVDFGTFWSVAFNKLIESFSTFSERIPTLTPSLSVSIERKFDLDKAEWYLQEIKKKHTPLVMQRLLEEFRTQLTDLPYAASEDWTKEIKVFTSSLFDIIQNNLDDEEQKLQALDFLQLIAHRCDKDTFEEIRVRFREVLQALYNNMLQNHQIKKAHDVLDLLQALNNYEPKFLKKLLMDAIYNWNDEEFESRYNDLDFYRCTDKNAIKEVKSELVSIMSKFTNDGDMKKAERSEKFYEMIRIL